MLDLYKFLEPAAHFPQQHTIHFPDTTTHLTDNKAKSPGPESMASQPLRDRHWEKNKDWARKSWRIGNDSKKETPDKTSSIKGDRIDAEKPSCHYKARPCEAVIATRSSWGRVERGQTDQFLVPIWEGQSLHILLYCTAAQKIGA